MQHEPTLGVSACLLGQTVRYDGGHKHDCCVTGLLGRYFRLLPVCPEVECGLPVPREPMRLEGDPAAPRLVAVHSRTDMTGQMRSYCTGKVRELADGRLCGFVFKKNSPSCGLHRVTVFAGDAAAGQASGLFAAALMRRLPLLPVADEEVLRDGPFRRNFLEQLRTAARGQEPALPIHPFSP